MSSLRFIYNFLFFADREYKCLGQWQENGFTYTFTQRKHVGTYECFVGSPISENEFMIREAGRHCERNINALLLGMVLTKKSKLKTVRKEKIELLHLEKSFYFSMRTQNNREYVSVMHKMGILYGQILLYLEF